MTFEEAQGELRRLLSVVGEVQEGLYALHAGLPASAEDLDTKDYMVHPVGTSGVRIAIEGLLTDQMEPAMRALRAALEIPEREERRS